MIFFLQKYKQIIKYLIAGGTAALVDLSLLYFLTDIFGIWYLISASLAFAAAFFVSFFLQKFWTFRDGDKEVMYKQMGVYLTVALVNLALNALFMYVLVDGFKVWYILAQIMASGLIACESYWIYKILIFNKRQAGGTANLKVLIATGIYPPAVGGPATYAENLSRELRELGCAVKIITYGKIDLDKKENIFVVDKKQNIILRYLNFFCQSWELSSWADIVYTLDLMSAGLPAALAAKLRGKKVVFRTGGDFLWEKAYHNGWTDISLFSYYGQKKNASERLLIYFCRWLFKMMDLVLFSTDSQMNIYKKHYGVASPKAAILKNALPAVKAERADERFKNSIIFAGRIIKLKNLDRLVEVFGKIRQAKIELLIFGDGPGESGLKKLILDYGLSGKVRLMGAVEHKKLMGIIAGCRFFILPSITEISPNLILECVGLAKPVVLTKETGLEADIIKHLLTFDPLSEADIKAKMEYLLDDNNLATYAAKLKRLNFSRRPWSLVAAEHLEIFKKILDK